MPAAGGSSATPTASLGHGTRTAPGAGACISDAGLHAAIPFPIPLSRYPSRYPFPRSPPGLLHAQPLPPIQTGRARPRAASPLASPRPALHPHWPLVPSITQETPPSSGAVPAVAAGRRPGARPKRNEGGKKEELGKGKGWAGPWERGAAPTPLPPPHFPPPSPAHYHGAAATNCLPSLNSEIFHCFSKLLNLLC